MNSNLERLSDASRHKIFLFKAKCKLIADNPGVRKGDIILEAMNLVNR